MVKSFDEWLSDLTKDIQDKEDDFEVVEDLDDFEVEGGELLYPCVSCGKLCPVRCDDLTDFDPAMHYCGRTPYCTP